MRIAIDWKKQAKNLAVYVGIAAFLSFINPYDATGSLSYPLALLYWLVMIVAGGLGADLAMHLYERIFPTGPLLGRLAIGAMAGAICVSAFIIVNETIFNDGIPISYWLYLYGLVLVISLAITCIGYVFERAFGDEANDTADQVAPEARFLQRLPIKFHAAQLHAIASEDHYLRVYTDIGEDLILMRLADAVRELANADGQQVHRSWWVAKIGIADEKRDNGRRILVLKSGTEVPVSRSFQTKAKAAGLLA